MLTLRLEDGTLQKLVYVRDRSWSFYRSFTLPRSVNFCVHEMGLKSRTLEMKLFPLLKVLQKELMLVVRSLPSFWSQLSRSMVVCFVYNFHANSSWFVGNWLSMLCTKFCGFLRLEKSEMYNFSVQACCAPNRYLTWLRLSTIAHGEILSRIRDVYLYDLF